MSEWTQILNVGSNICTPISNQICFRVLSVGRSICSPGVTNCLKINDIRKQTELFRITNITQPSLNIYQIFFTSSPLVTDSITLGTTTTYPPLNFNYDTFSPISPISENIVSNEQYIYFQISDPVNNILTSTVTYDRINNIFYNYVFQPSSFIEFGGLYNNSTWVDNAGAAGIGNWFFLSGSNTARYIKDSITNADTFPRSGIGSTAFFFGPSLSNSQNYIDAYFLTVQPLRADKSLYVDSNYFWNGGFRAIEFMVGTQSSDAVFRIEHGGGGDSLFLRTGSNFSVIVNPNIFRKAINTEIQPLTGTNNSTQTGILIRLKEINQTNYFYQNTLPITSRIRQIHFYVGGVLANNLTEQERYGMFVNNIRIGEKSSIEGLSSPNAPTTTNVTQTSFTANWNAVVGATSYRLDVSTSATFTTFLVGYNNLTVNSTSQNITGLTSNTTYYVRVRAVNSNETSNNSLALIQTTAGNTTIPSAPNTPTVTNVTQTSFVVNWDSVPGAISYRLDVSTDSSFSNFVSGFNNLTVNGTSQSITGLTAGGIYFIRVRAVNAQGVSDNSGTQLQITLFNAPSAPNTPTATSVTETSFTANWIGVVGATSYRLDVSTSATFATNLVGYNDLTVNGTSQSITGLTNNTTYYVRVRAVNSGGPSVNSQTLTQSTGNIAAPAVFSQSQSGTTSTSFVVNWATVNNATSYRIDVALDSNFLNFIPGYRDFSVNGNTVTVSNLNPGTQYFIRVRAVNDNLNLISLNTQGFRYTDPLAPSQLTATNVSTNSLTINWGIVSNATRYILEISTDINFLTNTQEYIIENITNQNITGLSSGTIYYIRVAAFIGIFGSEFSGVLTQSTSSLVTPLPPNTPTATSVTQTSFIANWNTVLGATSYRIDVSTSATFTTNLIGYNDLTVNGTTQSITGLNANTTYYVRVRSFNSNGTSASSGTLTQITLVGIPSAPSTPTATSVTQTSFTANWSAVAGATSYRIDVSTSATFATNLVEYNNLTVNGTTQSITGLTAGTTYYVRVRAVNTSGTSDNSGTLVQATLTSTIPSAPNTPTATSITQTSFTANWSAVAGATSYRIDVSTSSTFATFLVGYNNLTVNSTSQNITELTAGTTYYVRVRAVNANGTSANSSTLTQTTLINILAPSAPTFTNITETSFTANWNAVVGATSYRLDVSTSATFGTFIPGYNNLTVNSASQSVTGLITNTTYYVRVRAVNDNGTSPSSLISSQITNNTSSLVTTSPFTNMCLTKVAAGNNWSFIINSSGFLSGWGQSTALSLVPVPERIISLTRPFFKDIAIGGGSFAAGVGFNIACRDNGTISVWGETFRGNAIREIENADNYGFTQVGATLNTAIAKRYNYIYFMGDVNITDIINNTPTGLREGDGDPFWHYRQEFESFDCGYFHILLKTISGNLLGYTDYNYFNAGTIPSGLGKVSLYAAGYGYSLAIKQDGTITGWGVNGVTGDENGFPPGWTLQTILNSYGSGQLNIPNSVRQFASGNAWTGINSHFPWPGGKITKLVGGNGYAGAIVSTYNIDQLGNPSSTPLSGFYTWGGNIYYDRVPSIIPNIKDADIGRRSMLLIDKDNNLIYYGFNTGWSDIIDTSNSRSIIYGDYDYSKASSGFNNFCNNTFLKVITGDGYNISGSYSNLDLEDTIDLKIGDIPINPPGTYFNVGGVRVYPIASASPSFTPIIDTERNLTLGDLKNGSSPDAELTWRPGGSSFIKNRTNLYFYNTDDLYYIHAGSPEKINGNVLDMFPIEVPPVPGRSSSTVNWDCRINPLIINPCIPNQRRELRSECLNEYVITDWVYQSLTAQSVTENIGSDTPRIGLIEDVIKFFQNYTYAISSGFNICSGPCTQRKLSLTFNNSSLLNGFAQRPEFLNSGNFSSSMAFWFLNENKNEKYWSSNTQKTYEGLKEYFTFPSSNNEFIFMEFQEVCCPELERQNLDQITVYTTNKPEIAYLNVNFAPRLYEFSRRSDRDEYFITNDPHRFAYYRTNSIAFADSSLSSLQPLQCTLDISPHYGTQRELNTLVAKKIDTTFVSNGTILTGYNICVDAIGTVKRASNTNNAIFNLPGSRTPAAQKGYTVSRVYSEFTCPNISINKTAEWSAKPLGGESVYWTNEGVTWGPEYSNRSTQEVRRLYNDTYNNISRHFMGFGENFYMFKIRKEMRVSFDILRRGDQGAVFGGAIGLTATNLRWGLMTKRPNKQPFSYLEMPFGDRFLPLNTNLNLNKLISQVIEKASINSFAASSNYPISKFFVKERSSPFSSEDLSPRLLYPLKIDASYRLLSGYLSNNSSFDNSYIIGLQVLNSFGEPTGKEKLLINNNNIGWQAGFIEVPSGYIRSSFSDRVIIKSGYQYAWCQSRLPVAFEMPKFEDLQYSDNDSYLNENQVFWQFNKPIHVPLNHSVGMQIYSRNMGKMEERRFYNNENIFGYSLAPITGGSSLNIQFTPLNFKILDGNLPYIENPDYANLSVKQFVVTSPISDPIKIVND